MKSIGRIITVIAILFKPFLSHSSLEPTESFLQYLITFGALPFVVHGKKPISDAYFLELDKKFSHRRDYGIITEDFFSFFNPYKLSAYFGTTKLIESLKNPPSFAMFENEDKVLIAIEFQQHPFPALRVALVNLREVRRVLKTYKSAFQEILGKEFDEEKFLKKICHYPGDYDKFLKESIYLQGLLYGFGEENSRNFDRENRPYTCMIPPFFKVYPKNSNEAIPPRNKLLSSLQDEVSLNRCLIFVPGHVNYVDTSKSREVINRYRYAYKKATDEISRSNLVDWGLAHLVTTGM